MPKSFSLTTRIREAQQRDIGETLKATSRLLRVGLPVHHKVHGMGVVFSIDESTQAVTVRFTDDALMTFEADSAAQQLTNTR